MRMILTVLVGLALFLTGCGDNKGKVEKGGEVPPDPNAKPQNLGAPSVGGAAPAAKNAKTK